MSRSNAFEVCNRRVVADLEERACAKGSPKVRLQNRCPLISRYLNEVNLATSTVADGRNAVRRPHISHPLGSLAQNRHQVTVALMVRANENG